MKRLKHTALHLAVIGLVLAVAFYYSALYFTPEQVMAANERGLHYGPSRQILLEYDGPENTRLLIGKVDDRTLSVIPTQRAWMVFWKLSSDGITGSRSMSPGCHTVTGYEHKFQLFYGLTDCPGAANVRITLCAHSGSGERITQETLEVDENGFFYLPDFLLSDEEYNYYLSYSLIVYDAGGNLLSQENG
ncbi:MAG: hypothetical protein ACI3VN_01165 [Candidatus Onthomonas sp.]